MSDSNARQVVIPEGEVAEIIMRELCQHLLALCGTYLDVKAGQERPFSFSCFPVVMDDKCFLVTAGHVLRELSDLSSRGLLRHCSIEDKFGKDAKVDVPTVISFENIPKFFVDDESSGVDVGAMELREFYIEGIISNGVKPFNEEGWLEGERENAQEFLILGFPVEEDGLLGGVIKTVRPCVAGIKPSEIPSYLRRHNDCRFAGKLLADLPLSVKGMSGGPIFRLKDEEKGKRYWLYGMQVEWLPTERITMGHTMTTIAELIRANLK
jgi:hypothetical protein